MQRLRLLSPVRVVRGLGFVAPAPHCLAGAGALGSHPAAAVGGGRDARGADLVARPPLRGARQQVPERRRLVHCLPGAGLRGVQRGQALATARPALVRYDAITQLLFVTTFLFWLAASLDVSANGQRALERKFWHWLDPTLLAEGFFVLASIFAFGRLTMLFKFSVILGPLQVALENMLKDIAKFLFLFVFILICFSWGLNRFYQYYDGMSQKDPLGATTTQARSFVSFPRTLTTLFWCIFCMTPLESADVVIENVSNDEAMLVYNHHYFTQAVGYFCFVEPDAPKQRALWSVMEEVPPVDNPRDYAVLLATLAQRYFRQNEDWSLSPNGLSPATADMENLRREVRLLRSSLLPGLEEAMAAARSTEESALAGDSASMESESPSQPSTSETAAVTDTLTALATHRTPMPTLQESTVLSCVSGVELTQRDVSPVASKPSLVLTQTHPITAPHSGTSVPNREESVDPSIRNRDLFSVSSISLRDESPNSIIPLREVYVSTSILDRDKSALTDKESRTSLSKPPPDDSAVSPEAVPSTEDVNLTFMGPRRSCMELSFPSSESLFTRSQRPTNAVESGDFNAPPRRSVQRRRRTRGSRTRSLHLRFPSRPPGSPSDEESRSDVTSSAPQRRFRSRSRTRLGRHRPCLLTMREEDESEVAEDAVSMVDVVESNESRCDDASSSPESKHDVSTQESIPDVSCAVIFDSDPDVTSSYARECDSREIDFFESDVTSPMDIVYCPIHFPSVVGICDDVHHATEESAPLRLRPRSSDAEEGKAGFDWIGF